MVNKKAYFQGTEEPAPKGQKKYKVDPSILVQPRFEEPFYRNYDLYDTEGIDGPAQYGPGSGWNHMDEHKSIKEFLDFRRQRLKGKYVADDFWIEDTAANYKQRAEKMKVRASLLGRMIKQGSGCQDSDIEYTDRRDAFICGKCFHMGPNSGGETLSAKELHAGKNHNSNGIDWRNDGNREDPKYLKWLDQVSDNDENDGANYDYGDGAYTSMSEGKKMDTITDAPHKSPGAFFANAQYMLPPKEHGTSIYDAKNSPYQGIPKIPKQLKKNQDKQKVDDNATDFDIDNQIGSGKIQDTSELYEKPIKIGPGVSADNSSMPTTVGLGDEESYSGSVPIGGMLDKYLPQEDADGKPASELDFGHDLTEGAEMPGVLDPEDLERLTKKYLSPKENGLFGLPDGISPPDDLDPNATVNEPNPEYGETESGNTMYEDKWNI